MRERRLTVGSLIGGQSTVGAPTPVPSPSAAASGNVSASPAMPMLSRHHATFSSSSKLQVKQNGRLLEIVPVKGQTVLNAALAQQQPLAFKCGKGSCGRCAVQVLNGASLTPPTKQEIKTLQQTSATGCRLACQARFS